MSTTTTEDLIELRAKAVKVRDEKYVREVEDFCPSCSNWRDFMGDIYWAAFFQEDIIDRLVSENPDATTGELEELYIAQAHPPAGKTPKPVTIKQSRELFRRLVRYVPPKQS